MNNSALEHT